jgi:hypothetical protein
VIKLTIHAGKRWLHLIYICTVRQHLSAFVMVDLEVRFISFGYHTVTQKSLSSTVVALQAYASSPGKREAANISIDSIWPTVH